MPHDRLYSERHQTRTGSDQKLTHVSTIEMNRDDQGEEHLAEKFLPIDEVRDPLIDQFMRLN